MHLLQNLFRYQWFKISVFSLKMLPFLWRRCFTKYNFHCLMEDCGNSIANAMKLPRSCTKPSINDITTILQGRNELTHWGQVTHICVSNLTTTGSDNGLSPGRHQVIIWSNAGILSIAPLATNFHWNFYQNSYISIQENPFENGVWEMASILSRPQCVNLGHGQ